MEYLDVVNEDNEIIDRSPREIVHSKNLPHRTVMFFVLDKQGRILVTKRTENKDFFPGYWSIVLGGHVKSGESYEDALLVEMEEEVGVIGKYKEIDEFIKDIEEETEHVKVYSVSIATKKIKLCKKEIEIGEFWTKEKIKIEINQRDFLPETYQLVGYLDKL
ncbi:MAG: NUDIX hydrolase [Thermoplasmatota archaeon]